MLKIPNKRLFNKNENCGYNSGYIPTKCVHRVNTVKHAQVFLKLNDKVEILTVERILETIMKIKFRSIHEFYDISEKVKVQ